MEKYISPIMDKIRKQDISETLEQAKIYAQVYHESITDRRVYPTEHAIADLNILDTPLNDNPEEPMEILKLLNKYGSPATVAQTGGRYFGFVCGSIIPSSLPTKWLADTWDQNPAMFVLSPIASKIESIVEKWLLDLLGLPDQSRVGYVSGSSTATLVGICAARNYLLSKKGYDPIRQGLNELPRIKVIVGAGAHSTVYKALSLAGLGSDMVRTIPADDQGRMQAELLEDIDDLTLIIAQAGHVSSGAFDPMEKIFEKAKNTGAWIHVDGAFGLWAMADERFADSTKAIELADSWSVDGHKTLNAPYDNGIVICRHERSFVESMQMSGSYIIKSKDRDGMMYSPEMSRRARAIDLWSTLKGLGKQGIGEMVYEMHIKAGYFANKLSQIGFEILNHIHFNQIIARYQSNEATLKLIDAIQKSGVMWLGGAKWMNKDIMRISLCSYKTTYEDIDVCVEEIERLIEEI
ncbi:aspartate aminotransferase family protein [Acidaminobacter sp. JC074]|uniref:pyridoxal phosphate-dependent decarboxylase family protein n=1 Tax=Acidaminobacter sp. JC074 TaxID=2530199 RepID=UPI001F0F26D9|nr:aminotransferase class V-fold PLP-dependent enzyme [Acidaminobacter sp. JC074]MCH4887865.1 aspartate aminotransferase family protein [Acidaminobacter sp. JC074]